MTPFEQAEYLVAFALGVILACWTLMMIRRSIALHHEECLLEIRTELLLEANAKGLLASDEYRLLSTQIEQLRDFANQPMTVFLGMIVASRLISERNSPEENPKNSNQMFRTYTQRLNRWVYDVGLTYNPLAWGYLIYIKMTNRLVIWPEASATGISSLSRYFQRINPRPVSQ